MKHLIPILIAGILVSACGKDGKNGRGGFNGTDGRNGSDGAVGAAGANGTNGAKGDKGDKGDQGEIGSQGAQGAAGVAGVTSVKFCPNLLDQYGVAYAEYGLCIDNKVYAVYSVPGQAFMAQLSNGNYRTTTPYGNCSFNVTACVITSL